jgi:hypothetical protein
LLPPLPLPLVRELLVAATAGFAGAAGFFAAGLGFAATAPTRAKAAKTLISFFMLSPEILFSPAVAEP